MNGHMWLNAQSYSLWERANFKGLPTPGKSIIGSIKKKFSGGGGSSGGGSSTSAAMAEAEAQLFLERELAKLHEEQRIAQEERDRLQYEEDLGKFNTNTDNAFTVAQSQGESEILRRGLDPERFNPLLLSALQTTRLGIPELASNPSSYFNTNDILNTVLGDETSLERRRLNQQIDQYAAPGFAYNQIPSTLDDPILASILDSQYQDALSGITRARDRGNLTDFGFTSALDALGSQRSAADTRLQGLGSGVLEDIRVGGRDIANQARSRADAFQFGDTFDPSVYQQQISELFGERTGRLEGDIRGALGGESLFDIGNILSRGSVAQGAQNAARSSPVFLASLAQREEDRAKKRGIGTQGVF